MPVSSTATVTPCPVSPWAASRVAPVSWRNASDGVWGPVDSGVDCTLTERSEVTVMPGSASSTGSRAVGTSASTPLMRWYRVRMVPPTPSTAVTGLSSPVAVTMTVSIGLAEAAGTPVTDVAAKAAASAAAAAAARPFLRPARWAGPRPGAQPARPARRARPARPAQPARLAQRAHCARKLTVAPNET